MFQLASLIVFAISTVLTFGLVSSIALFAPESSEVPESSGLSMFDWFGWSLSLSDPPGDHLLLHER